MKILKTAVYVLIGFCIICMAYLAIKTVPENTLGYNPVPQKIGHVNSIVSICKPAPFIIMGLDANANRLVGVNPETKIAMQSNVLNKFFPHFQQKSDQVCNNAFKPNIEELIRLKPDLIVQWKRLPDEIAQMESFGFNVLGLNYEGTEQGDREMVRLLAEATGKTARYDSMMKLRDSLLNHIRPVANAVPMDKRPKVIFIRDYENWRVGGEKCFEHFCIELCGGRNMGIGLGVERNVNIEQILVWNPDIIILAGWRKDIIPDGIYQNPILQEVNAVKKKKVVKMPVWASNESPLTWMWVANIIQPDYFRINIREEVKKSYRWQYNINLSEADVNQVLFCDVNYSSPLYTNFLQN